MAKTRHSSLGASPSDAYLDHWLQIADLLEAYGALLPDRMAAMLHGYYVEDMTLSELADLDGISRQAVHDRIKRGTEHLERYEATLGVLARQKALADATRSFDDAMAMTEPESRTEALKGVRQQLHDILDERSP